MDSILQGTTPTLIIEITDPVPVSSILSLELAIKHKGQLTIFRKSDVELDTETNSIIKRFSETETLAMDPESDLFYQLRVKTVDGIYGTDKTRVDIMGLMSEAPIE